MTTMNNESPFSGLKIDNYHRLDEVEGRTTCEKCNKSRKYFCYSCYCPVLGLEELTPRVKLPLKVDVIKHPYERDGKSTACHAAVISPDVSIHVFPVIPDLDKNRTLLVFPGEDAVQLKDLAALSHQTSLTDPVTDKRETEESTKCDNTHPPDSLDIKDRLCSSDNFHPSHANGADTIVPPNNSPPNNSPPRNQLSSEDVGKATCDGLEKKAQAASPPPFDRVVFIDSTWNQTYRISQDERLKGLQKVELQSRTTNFWRNHQGNPETYLSTIEAIYYFMCDYHELFLSTTYEGQYDNLLFFFACLHEKVNSAKCRKKIKTTPC
ncbi:tRNA-uridine aminocarboxypropyltransferase 1-like [Haliotis rubra]|uniref:tRNA-uridine aminocarboxypropyltransferase 1-like n=1 Tax=Haliotis rubra TaxID=36100 RepID=UPI001EE58430|nr:tRNA-uridine aminocarboxypropyltransferase 1-like [Haliotis rubra]XP_046561706.1 tRNA-uridine aminocarboxypropyltransferase 1-like [Haliotis rubra]